MRYHSIFTFWRISISIVKVAPNLSCTVSKAGVIGVASTRAMTGPSCCKADRQAPNYQKMSNHPFSYLFYWCTSTARSEKTAHSANHNLAYHLHTYSNCQQAKMTIKEKMTC